MHGGLLVGAWSVQGILHTSALRQHSWQSYLAMFVRTAVCVYHPALLLLALLPSANGFQLSKL